MQSHREKHILSNVMSHFSCNHIGWRYVIYNPDQLSGELKLLPQGIVGWDYLVSFCKSKVKCIPFLKTIRKETLKHLYFTPFEEFIASVRKKMLVGPHPVNNLFTSLQTQPFRSTIHLLLTSVTLIFWPTELLQAPDKCSLICWGTCVQQVPSLL